MSAEPKFYGQGDPLMEAAFASCVQWAWNHPATRREFERKSNLKMAPDGLAAMIDAAAGYDEEVAEAFVRFVRDNVWGRQKEHLDKPSSMRS